MFEKRLGIVLLLTTMLLMVGCGGTTDTVSQPQESQKPSAQLLVGTAPGPVSYALAHMAENPDQQNITLKPWKQYDQLLAMITSHQVDISSTPLTNAIMLYNKGIDVQLINVSVWGMLYVLSPDDSIKQLEDLREKEIAVAGQGGIHDLVFRHLLVKNDLDPDNDVTFIYMDLPEASAKLATGEIQYAVLNEPNSSMATLNARKGGVELHRVLDLQQEWQKITGQEQARIPQAGFILTDTRADKNAVFKFHQEYVQSADWINQHPEEAGPMVEKQFEWMKAPAVQQSLQFARLDPRPAIECKAEVEAFFQELSQTAPLEAIGGKIPDDGFYFQP